MRKSTGRVMFGLAAAMMALLLAGCGEKQCFFVTQDSKGLKTGANVIWVSDALLREPVIVGKVAALEEVDGGTKVSIKFAKKYKSLIHDGVAGCVVVDEKSAPHRVGVLLAGGKDESRPLLEDGDQIPESRDGGAAKEGFAAFVEWIRTSRTLELQLVCTTLLIILVLLKFVSRRFKLILFLGLLCAVGYVYSTVKNDWSSYKARFSNVKSATQEAKSWILQHGEKLHVILETALEADDD
ncbi:MAG: hypothetical protein IJH50_04955 [Kiritimatiellae bacterium]|nr:hypothetical protein [Kiritimatiellia bacterium]